MKMMNSILFGEKVPFTILDLKLESQKRTIPPNHNQTPIKKSSVSERIHYIIVKVFLFGVTSFFILCLEGMNESKKFYK